MTDDFEFLRSLRPEPEPDAAVTERHRTELRRRMGTTVATPPDETGDLAYTERPLPSLPIRGTPLRRMYALAGVAAAILLLAGGLVLTALDVPSDQADEVQSVAPLTCGDRIPATFEVPGATSGPIVGPGPGSDPAEAGQYVVHWLRDEGMVELRWPAPPLDSFVDARGWTSTKVPGELVFRTPDGGDDTAAFTAKKFFPLGSEVTSDEPLRDGDGNVVEGTVTELVGDPDLSVDTAGQPAPEAGCEIVELRTIGAPGQVRSAFDLTDLQQDLVVGSVVDATATVGDDPPEPYSCPREPLPGSEANNAIPPQDPLPEPADVLKRSVEGASDYADNWTEWLEPDGTYTYTRPDGDDDRGVYFVYTMVPSGDGWVMESFNIARC